MLLLCRLVLNQNKTFLNNFFPPQPHFAASLQTEMFFLPTVKAEREGARVRWNDESRFSAKMFTRDDE